MDEEIILRMSKEEATALIDFFALGSAIIQGEQAQAKLAYRVCREDERDRTEACTGIHRKIHTMLHEVTGTPCTHDIPENDDDKKSDWGKQWTPGT